MKNMLLIVYMGFCACDAHAALIEEAVQIPVEVTDRHQRTHQKSITVTIFRDDARGKSPFLVLNHGRATTRDARAKLGQVKYFANSAYFVEKGFAVFVPTRVGYGVTGGPDVEDSGDCKKRDYPPGYEAAAAQSVAVIHYAKSRDYVDAARGIVVGQSYGGMTAVALAAKNIDGVLGAINFAGGGGGNPDTHPWEPCDEGKIRDLFAAYGKTARGPTLWLYSHNDRFMGNVYPAQWVDIYKKQGGNAQFVPLPAHGKDGHGSFTSNSSAWMPAVEKFLKSLGFSN
jgi:dienelactone hydrolase